MVACERGPFGVGRGRKRRGGADPVAVGIGCQHQVGADRFRLLDDGIEHGRIFWIGDVSGHVRKIAVRLGVRGEDFDIGEVVGLEHWADG